MSYQRLVDALLLGRPYFGPALRSLQGHERHRYILPVVEAAAKGARAEILEVGSWAGASAISWASALKKLGLEGRVTCVDPWLPYFRSQQQYAGHYGRMNRAAERGVIYKLFQHNVVSSGFADTIVAKPGKSSEVLPKLASGSFHVVYLDGSHMLEDVLFDLREAKRLVRPEGIICGDDLELQLKELDPSEAAEAARSGQEYAWSNSAGAHYHPGVTLAVAQEFGEVCTWDGFWAVTLLAGNWGKVTVDLSKSAVPEHVAAESITFEAETFEHHLISMQGRYFALAKQLGPPDIVAELLGDDDVPPLIFTASTLEELQGKVQRHYEAQRVKGGMDWHAVPHLSGSHRGFNLVQFKGKVYGLRQTLGDLDISVGDSAFETRYGDQDVIIGDSLDGVKAGIDAVEAQRVAGA